MGRVGQKTASREVRIFFFPDFIFFKTRLYRGGGGFLAHPAGGQETTFYLRVALAVTTGCRVVNITPEGVNKINYTYCGPQV